MAGRLIRPARRAAWVGLLLAVLAAHLLATRWLADNLAGWGRAQAMPERLSAVFVRELAPAPAPAAAAAPPPPVARAAPRKPKRPRVQPAQAAASQPTRADAAAPPPAAVADVPPAAADMPLDVATPAPMPRDATIAGPDGDPSSRPAALADALPGAASAPVSSPAPAAALAAASTPAAAPDWPAQWPASTRLSYSLTGWFRGDVHGAASVEWLRDGTRYQVHLDVAVGPSFAPFMARRMSSDGELTLDGLAPRRYDEQTRIGFNAPRHATIRFEPDAVVLANGRRRERWAGVQDAASQFVHLSWLFTTQPQLLAAGRSLEIPLALPRNVDRWIYDVQPAEDLRTPFGTLPVWHLKPRRMTRPTGDMVIEAWFAPTLLYLPVRIRIHQDAQTWVDLLIDRPPLQAAAGPAGN